MSTGLLASELLAPLTETQILLMAQIQSLLPNAPEAALISAVRKMPCLGDAVSWLLEQEAKGMDEDGMYGEGGDAAAATLAGHANFDAQQRDLSHPQSAGARHRQGCGSTRCATAQGGGQQHRHTKQRSYFAPHVLQYLDTSQHTVVSSLLRSQLRIFLGPADRGRLGAAAPTWYEVAWGKGGRKRQGIGRTHLENLDRKLFFASGGGGDAVNVPLMRVLISWNASPCGYRGDCGVTALHYAALKADDNGLACTCLLNAGASAAAVDLAGRTPRDWARLKRVKALLAEKQAVL